MVSVRRARTAEGCGRTSEQLSQLRQLSFYSYTIAYCSSSLLCNNYCLYYLLPAGLSQRLTGQGSSGAPTPLANLHPTTLADRRAHVITPTLLMMSARFSAPSAEECHRGTPDSTENQSAPTPLRLCSYVHDRIGARKVCYHHRAAINQCYRLPRPQCDR